MKVSEIFYSIQGESSYAGRPCVFVRLSGCNLRCTYCDTRYAYDGWKEMEIEEIISQVASYRCRLVEVTGGEPLIQEETPDLIRRMLERGFDVLLETNGSCDISIVDKRCVKIMDIKCPSSGEDKRNDPENLKRLSDKDEVKFVIGDENDYKYAKEILSSMERAGVRIKAPLFSPVYGRLDPKLLAEWILEDRLDVRLQIQLHKVIWDAETRGV